MHVAAALLILALGEPWQSPMVAFEVASTDAKTLGPAAIYHRYVHLPEADERLLKWHVYTVNECVADLRNPHIVLPEVLAGGHVARWDLRHLAPRIRSDGEPDVFRLMAVWDRIFDESLYVRLVEPQTFKIATPAYKANDGKTYRHKVIRRDHSPDAIFEPHATSLMAATLTNTPLVSLHEFQRHAMTTVDGGLYYDFLGLPSTVGDLLKLFGADQAKLRELRSELKAVTVVSGVTNGPRRVLVFPGIQSRPSDNQGLIWGTHDFIAAQMDVESDPARNLHGENHDASEWIIERANGGHVYYLANGQGKRQDSAPDTVATDTTIESHGDQRLQPAKSCVVCHALNGDRGIRTFGKDTDSLLSADLEYPADRDTPYGDEFDHVQRTLSQYRWNPDKMVSRARDDYSDFMIRATGDLQPEDIGELTRLFFRDYWERPVTPEQACHELGISVAEGDDPTQILRRSIPPRATEITPGLIAEDVYIATLCHGTPITRANFLQVVLEMRRRLRPQE